MKDVTVKQVTLNVTDIDEISMDSSPTVLEMSSFSMDTHTRCLPRHLSIKVKVPARDEAYRAALISVLIDLSQTPDKSARLMSRG